MQLTSSHRHPRPTLPAPRTCLHTVSEQLKRADFCGQSRGRFENISK